MCLIHLTGQHFFFWSIYVEYTITQLQRIFVYLSLSLYIYICICYFCHYQLAIWVDTVSILSVYVSVIPGSNQPITPTWANHWGGDNRFGWLRSMAGNNPTGLFSQALHWKSQMPHYVLLVQVGPIYGRNWFNGGLGGMVVSRNFQTQLLKRSTKYTPVN